MPLDTRPEEEKELRAGKGVELSDVNSGVLLTFLHFSRSGSFVIAADVI